MASFWQDPGTRRRPQVDGGRTGSIAANIVWQVGSSLQGERLISAMLPVCRTVGESDLPCRPTRPFLLPFGETGALKTFFCQRY